ncbi:hypothetical protein BpHYR1_000898 [Brachionus plicatilis]|uniref:Uncharacterized protein n=1 Tax=Brachionus plicatilis TaxID=10195 RepID=A0A3M7SFC7_BRAPC|nr:hypothetical protein BpHYR1_000898 [Brachionus plicatilis]
MNISRLAGLHPRADKCEIFFQIKHTIFSRHIEMLWLCRLQNFCVQPTFGIIYYLTSLFPWYRFSPPFNIITQKFINSKIYYCIAGAFFFEVKLTPEPAKPVPPLIIIHV